jgi:hypothetical protein
MKCRFFPLEQASEGKPCLPDQGLSCRLTQLIIFHWSNHMFIPMPEPNTEPQRRR